MDFSEKNPLIELLIVLTVFTVPGIS